MASAAEAELAALYITAREMIPLRNALEEMGWKQPPSPVQTDNSTATGFIHDTIIQRRIKMIWMRLHWLRCRATQGQFRFYWDKGTANMADYHTNENGIMIGKGVPFAKPHRHYSHMLGIFPFYETNIDNNVASIPMLKKTVQHFTDVDGDNCMYKFSGASSIWSSLGDGDNALKWVNRSLDIFPRIGEIPKIPTCTPNTMYCERGNPTFESPISSSRAMLDMLIQSWGNVIRVFPRNAFFMERGQFLSTQGRRSISGQRQKGKWQNPVHSCKKSCR